MERDKCHGRVCQLSVSFSPKPFADPRAVIRTTAQSAKPTPPTSRLGKIAFVEGGDIRVKVLRGAGAKRQHRRRKGRHCFLT